MSGGSHLPEDEHYSYSTSTSSASYFEQSEETKDIVSFIDENEGGNIGSGAGNNVYATMDATKDTDLANFLRRPVRIDSYTWLESDTVGVKQTINPWYLWATNPAIQNKLHNYAFIRGDLHIKIVINASPFYYGMTQVSYLPLQVDKPSTIVNDAGTRYLILLSQRPRMYLDPQKQEAGCMTLPFLLQQNMLYNQGAANFAALGQLDYTIYSVLKSANGVTGAGISVTTYAWMENVTLSGASVVYAAQSDEYGEGPISKPASAVANAASYLEKVPVIGPFATATRIGASAVSAIASIFGFTNVPVIEDTKPMRNEPFPKLASSEISHPVEKLTLDPKNELSIDPRVVGMPDGTDEMMISNLVQRESYLCSAAWTTSNATDDVLFYSQVNPRRYDNDGATNAKLYMTPMCFISNLFDNWRGDIIFKFKIVASKYHKGRLRLSFDPCGDNTYNMTTVPNSTNIIHTKIIDIGEVNEVEFRVPYQQAKQFLYVRPSVAAASKGWAVNTPIPTAPYIWSSLYDNGVISLRVLNILTAPIASSSVDILVYVRAAENLEFANPTIIDPDHVTSYFAPQSEDIPIVKTKFASLPEIDDNVKLEIGVGQNVEIVYPPETGTGIEIYYPQSEEYAEETAELSSNMGILSLPSKDQYTVHFGENIKSLRQLLRRYNYHSTNYFGIAASTGGNTWQQGIKHFYKVPTTPGYISTGTETAVSLLGGANYNYNFCQMTHIAYIMNAFLAYRGSINWSFNAQTATGPLSEMRVSRNNYANYQASYTTQGWFATTKSFYARNITSIKFDGNAGQAITNCNTNAGMNVQCPNYSAYSFQFTNPANANLGVTTDGSAYDQYTLELITKQSTSAIDNPFTVSSYVGIGTDFSLHYFINVPTLWIYSALPAAP